MATRKIVKHGFGDLSVITMPFTAPTDGILLFQTNPDNSNGCYATILIDNNTNQRLQLASPTGSGVGTGGSIPIKKGQVATVTLSNCSLVTRSFLPLL